MCKTEKIRSSYSPFPIADWKNYVRKKNMYELDQKLKKQNMVPSFPNNFFDELQVKICFRIIHCGINKRLLTFQIWEIT